MAKNLTDKQEAFCREYMIDFNATQAAIRAGYSKKTAGQIGEENLKKPEIDKRVASLKAEAAKRNDIKVDDLIEWHKKAVFLKVDTFADIMPNGMILKDFDEIPEEWKPFIQKITTTSSGGVQVDFIDKLGSARELGKIIGAYEKDNDQKKAQLPIINIIQAPDDDEEGQ